jgi:hypothetical protein
MRIWCIKIGKVLVLHLMKPYELLFNLYFCYSNYFICIFMNIYDFTGNYDFLVETLKYTRYSPWRLVCFCFTCFKGFQSFDIKVRSLWIILSQFVIDSKCINFLYVVLAKMTIFDDWRRDKPATFHAVNHHLIQLCIMNLDVIQNGEVKNVSNIVIIQKRNAKSINAMVGSGAMEHPLNEYWIFKSEGCSLP